MKQSLEFEVRESEGPLDTPFGVRLRKIEARITKSDESGIRARWECGRELLKKRGDKKLLPKGLLDQVAAGLNVKRPELKARMRFAAKFPSEEQLADTVSQFVSWHRIVHEALPDKRAPKRKARSVKQSDNVVRVRLEWKQWRARLTEIRTRANDLTETDLSELDKLQEAIADIFTAREELTQKRQAR